MSRPSAQTKRLQQIDGWVFPYVCACFTFWRWLMDLIFRPDIKTEPKSIIFLKLAEQGSTVLANEAIRQAVAKVGKENVFFLMFEENRFILDVMDLIPRENVLTIRTKSAVSMVTSCLSRLWAIRRRKIDVCIDMEFFARASAIIAYMMGTRMRVGFHCYFGEGPYRGNLCTHRVLYNSHMHASKTFLSLVRALDNDPDAFPTFGFTPPAEMSLAHFKPEDSEREEVAAMLRELAGTDASGRTRRVILLNANASDLMPLRRWENSNYVELARRLLETHSDIAIAFTGGPSEAEKIEKLVAEVNDARCFSLAGKTTLRQLLIVYGLAEILVTNDSGPAHFAALTPVDVVVLFGPETPLLFGTLSPRNHNIWLGLACSPCINAWNNRQTACNNNLCMKNIPVSQVFDTVCSVYKQRTAHLQ
ncbi:ADP-heptose:LPS heptosyltransferase [Ereboglobus sp. PH5-10]|uniref:glycosyltransferase family 9 protein n=1 Tax=Ereboglobus sp. PH5-10 TaxID=2940629 RepID=UPI0024051F09|nr:glycosyltransferase family 9 protein [Ereboglobus sp. PH5-10]MDF9826053.1 ADP-heptose:LPS heptosyltransferase [Ereboglobus sp. PH5-10]